jgi:hypothetical protein
MSRPLAPIGILAGLSVCLLPLGCATSPDSPGGAGGSSAPMIVTKDKSNYL